MVCLFIFLPFKPTDSTVATAGGEVVCVIDCEVGKVTHKYVHAGEDFYTIAVADVDGVRVLAAAGASHHTEIVS